MSQASAIKRAVGRYRGLQGPIGPISRPPTGGLQGPIGPISRPLSRPPRGPGPQGGPENGPEGSVWAIQEIFPDSWVCQTRFWPSRMPSEAYVSRSGGSRHFEFLSRGQRQVFRRSRQCFFEIETRAFHLVSFSRFRGVLASGMASIGKIVKS